MDARPIRLLTLAATIMDEKYVAFRFCDFFAFLRLQLNRWIHVSGAQWGATSHTRHCENVTSRSIWSALAERSGDSALAWRLAIQSGGVLRLPPQSISPGMVRVPSCARRSGRAACGLDRSGLVPDDALLTGA